MLGGSEFVGRAVVDEGLRRGWQVTTLNRGSHPTPPGVTALRGDRTTRDGLSATAGLSWNIVVDTWSWAPAAVRRAGESLAGRTDSFVYVSSRSVYRFPTDAGADEEAPVVDASPDDDSAPEYARAKRGGELAATVAFGSRALLARAGLIVGPGENVGRLPWWLNRIARGGPVVAPGPAGLSIQLIDARDLARFVLDATARGLGGPYNLSSRNGSITMEDLLEACVRATGSDTELRWMSSEVLLAAGIEPWRDLPIWAPPGELHDSLHRASVEKAMAAGLALRDVSQTVSDTWTWLKARGGHAPQRPDRPRVGLPEDVEARLLSSTS